jgi:hypothetical protein
VTLGRAVDRLKWDDGIEKCNEIIGMCHTQRQTVRTCNRITNSLRGHLLSNIKGAAGISLNCKRISAFLSSNAFPALKMNGTPAHRAAVHAIVIMVPWYGYTVQWSAVYGSV